MREDLRVGGQYTAIDNNDGTYNIVDFPLFAEVPAGVKRNKEPIGKSWQDQALVKSREREKEGHLPPVHIYHSDEVSQKPIYAGKLRLRAVRASTYEGETRWTTFGDILGMPKAVFDKVRAGFLSYRSVEIHNWDKPEIDSLALMDTDVPFFRMPMLTIGKVVKRDPEMFLGKGPSPAFACFVAEAPSMAILFKFDDGKKPAPEETDEEPVAEEDEEQIAPEGAEEEDETSPSPEGARPTPKGGSDLSGQQSQMLLQQLVADMQMIKQRLGPQPPPEEKLEAVAGLDLAQEAQEQPGYQNKEKSTMADKSKDTVVPAGEPVVTMKPSELEALIAKTVDAAVLKATTPLLAEVDTMKSVNAKRDQELAVKSRFEAAKTELTQEGCVVGEEVEKALFKCATIGEDFVKDMVVTLKKSLPKEAPPSVESFEAGIVESVEGAESNQEVINTFCSERGNNPKIASWAKGQVAAFQAYQKVSGSDMSLEDWLKVNFRSDNMRSLNRV